MGNIRPDGLFADSVLNKDDEVIAINKISCAHLQPSDAVAITQKNPESVEVLVRLYRANCVVLSHLSGLPTNPIGADTSRTTTRSTDGNAVLAKCGRSVIPFAIAVVIVLFL